jgi:hypothetical protein
MSNTDELTNIGLRNLIEDYPEIGPLLFKTGVVGLRQVGDEIHYVDGRTDSTVDENETVNRLSEAYRTTKNEIDS